MHAAASGVERCWSTSTPIALIFASQAAARTPLPVLPATWKRTSGLFAVMNCAANALPPAGSWNAAVKSPAET
jgi:hypothetical protein